MPTGNIAIVFDCGATNVRVIAVNDKGDILASESYATIRSPILFILPIGSGMQMRSGIKCAWPAKKCFRKSIKITSWG